MSFIIVGLGNPGEEYTNTRHNAGRMMVEAFAKKHNFTEFEENKSIKAHISKGKIGKETVTLVLPETFMNRSGAVVKELVKNEKAAQKLVVVYDDFQLPLGKLKMSYNRSSGGHNGLESIIKALKTEAFARIRVGLSKANAKGVAKIPRGPEEVEKFILGEFKKEELDVLKKVAKDVSEGIETFVAEGRDTATMVVNSK